MNLAVTSSARRQGIGRDLLRHALRLGLKQGACRALLEVRASNAPALALYEGAGFTRKAVRMKYYTNPVEDAVLMEMVPLQIKVKAEAEPQPQPLANKREVPYDE
jgi:[ribosomal protein S18]-alanine N-acetyltransferase